MRNVGLMIIGILIFSSGVSAQPHVEEYNRRKEAKVKLEADLKKAADISATAKELKAKVDAQEKGVIIPAAKTGDVSLIPYLKLLALDSDARRRLGTDAFEAHTALAILGEPEAISQILAEAEAENRGLENGASLMKLALIASRMAYQILYETLDNNLRPTSNADDEFFPTRSISAMSVLAVTVKEPPTGSDRNSVAAWKAWFEKNKHLIE